LFINLVRDVGREDPADGESASEDNTAPWPQASSREKHLNDDDSHQVLPATSTERQPDTVTSTTNSAFMNVPTQTAKFRASDLYLKLFEISTQYQITFFQKSVKFIGQIQL
jgi:hypothetical protein